MKKKLLLLPLIILTMLLSSCGIHPRNPDAIPPRLRTLYLQLPTAASEFTIKLTDMLKSQKIKLLKSPHNAPVTLDVTDTYTSTFSTLVVTTTLVATVTLLDKKHSVLAARNFAQTRSIVLSNNQVTTSYVTESTKQELANDVVNLVYYWLVSGEVHHALATHKQIHHAN